MEEQSQEPSAFKGFELEIGQEIKGYLKEISSWSYFLAIIGFIGVFLMIIMGLYFMTLMSSYEYANGYSGYNTRFTYFGLIYIGMAIVFFFPMLYLLNSARKFKSALRTQDNTILIQGFSNLKSYFKFLGIFTIIIVGMYVLLFIIGFAGALA